MSPIAESLSKMIPGPLDLPQEVNAIPRTSKANDAILGFLPTVAMFPSCRQIQFGEIIVVQASKYQSMFELDSTWRQLRRARPRKRKTKDTISNSGARKPSGGAVF
jgi:hypothetical protein